MKFFWVLVAVLVAIFLLLLLPKETTSATLQSPAQINDVRIIVIEAALRHEIDVHKFLATARCESKFRSIQSGIIKNGKREKSYGIFQIHLPDHPNVTKQQALDPYFASEWSAKKFKENPRIWACYKQLYGSRST